MMNATHPTMDLAPPLRLHGRGPTLATFNEIEAILRSAPEAMSLNAIKRAMKAHEVRHATIRTAIDEFERRGWVTEGSKGVVWTFQTNRTLWDQSRPL